MKSDRLNGACKLLVFIVGKIRISMGKVCIFMVVVGFCKMCEVRKSMGVWRKSMGVVRIFMC